MSAHLLDPPIGPIVGEDAVTFTVADPQRKLDGVRLRDVLHLPADQLGFTWRGGAWTLRLRRPRALRMEYLLELTHADGGTETVPDPANPHTVPGAFGEKSVVEFPGYHPPSWLDSPARPGTTRRLEVSDRRLDDPVVADLWTPAGLTNDRVAPLLVVHDGPEYDRLGRLTTYLSSQTSTRELPPLRAALLHPGDRNERYSAEPTYTVALGETVLPRLRAEVPTSAVVGMGASLGALAMLTAHRAHPRAFDALFLQSGSFFHPRHDAHERRFGRYPRIVRAVAEVLRGDGRRSPVPTVMTCGSLEENLANNRIMARALAAQGYDVTLREVADVHNFTAWRDTFHPWLTLLVRQLTGG